MSFVGIFAKTTYAIKNLDILLSPQNYYPSNKLNFLYQKIIKQAKKIYDYIIVDIEKNGKFLASKKFSSTETIFMITTVDNLSITKTNNFIDKLNEKNSLSNIKIIFNQTGNFSKEDLSSIFKTTSVCNLPTEINGAWDNIFLGIPIVENKHLKYSKKIETLIKNILKNKSEF